MTTLAASLLQDDDDFETTSSVGDENDVIDIAAISVGDVSVMDDDDDDDGEEEEEEEDKVEKPVDAFLDTPPPAFFSSPPEKKTVLPDESQKKKAKESERDAHDADYDGSERGRAPAGDDEFSDHKESHRKEVFVSGSETVSRDVYVNRGWRVSIADSGVSTVCEYHDEFSERKISRRRISCKSSCRSRRRRLQDTLRTKLRRRGCEMRCF